ncbi:hypothetical protein [Streptomyces clavuligerus]|uniref:Uncharacterized protein n=1 Tax=Streptomyces clavuligerus TaxID=1901 RepID=B5GMT7_STRCL|nr:hypothetical protein [Streptomyces clavuligerus]ANW22665.1 hypothetical protein BB341_28625 [Streptomyces clavuligerus]AXU17196.1 hypothetical protein D1794_31705 [Streptomyces clavuligerus]EDY47633.1 hypothetical protein SSCG_00661 [Streptomyces clavuligerus]EFG04372.1 Hypothetical protein SCLAV_p0886 [Streptomyces clavuligerus]MBY6307160.1 hypothetical protein [Streptomyces clavuligerus]
MTKTETSPLAPGRVVVGAEAARLGKWVLVPRTTHPPAGRTSLQHEGQRIELTYSSSVLKQLLTSLEQIQSDFRRLSGPTGVPMRGDA